VVLTPKPATLAISIVLSAPLDMHCKITATREIEFIVFVVTLDNSHYVEINLQISELNLDVKKNFGNAIFITFLCNGS